MEWPYLEIAMAEADEAMAQYRSAKTGDSIENCRLIVARVRAHTQPSAVDDFIRRRIWQREYNRTHYGR